MDRAQPGHTVKFQGLKGASHLNGKEGTLIRFISKEKRWCVRCDGNGEDVKAKPENLVIQRTSSSSNISTRFDTFNKQCNAAFTRAGGGALLGVGPGGMSVGEIGRPNSAVANDPASWANGLSQTDQYEWFSNCYQMRCDDDYAWGGCNLHGPYLPDVTPESIAKDFQIFCILAHRAKAVPADWDWKSFLKAATNYIPYAFEKSDAKERWGSENYFEGASGAGRSLRYTGMQIYKSGVDEPGDSNEHTQVASEVDGNGIVLQDHVGGRNAWGTLVRDLSRSKRFSG